ncbi:hypothetical protein AB1Y20_007583 [Prymnesium parvum]|uniref:60S acidic ribosomal protein P2 n=1 Tax=Prymnesium parvum TaxID=97485 RepID=A0AB34IXY2_PRYPA
MKNVAAYMLCQLGGKDPTVENCTSILESVGCEVDAAKLGALLSSLEGKDIVEVLAAGRAKMAAMPVGGGGGGAVAAAAPAAAAGGGAAAAPAAEKKKPEPEPEEEEEDMGFDLFD